MKLPKIILSVFIVVLFSNSFAFSADRNMTSEANDGVQEVAIDKIQKEEISDLKKFRSDKKKSLKLKRYQRRFIRKILKDDPELDDEVLLVILAILLPPLAVYLVEGIGDLFWIDLILTLLGWVPGMIFALYIVLR